MDIVGTVHDIKPNHAKPTLELAFARRDCDRLSNGHKVPVTLLIKGVSWRGTMRNDGSRDAYVHTRLHSDSGQSATCTEILAEMRIGHNARLRFEVLAPDTLRLDQIIEFGESREGHAARARERNASHHTPPLVRSPAPTHARSQLGSSGFPFGDCDAIRRLAEAYWDLITPAEAAEERRFENDFSDARRQGFLSKELFVRVGRWKSVRQTPNYESNPAEVVRTASAKAFEASDDATALTALTSLRGVALRTASAILQWMRPRQFPILDVRVVSALGWPEPASWDDLAFYSRVSDRVRELARECDMDLRTMDRALWAWDKQRSVGQA